DQQWSSILGIDDLRSARQMRDQVRVCRPQHEVCFAGGKFHPRAFLDADDVVSHQLAANQQLDAEAQNLQVAAALAIDKEGGIVGFKLRIQSGLPIFA